MSYSREQSYQHPSGLYDTPAPIGVVKALWRARWGQIVAQEAWFSVFGPIVGGIVILFAASVVAAVWSEDAAEVAARWLVVGWCLWLRTLRSAWLFELVETVQLDPNGVTVRRWKRTLEAAAIVAWWTHLADRAASFFIPTRIIEALLEDRVLTNEDLFILTVVYGVAGLLCFWAMMSAYGSVHDHFIEPVPGLHMEEYDPFKPVKAGEGWAGLAFVYGLTGAIWVPMVPVALQLGQRMMGPIGWLYAVIGVAAVTWVFFVPAWLFLDLLALVSWRQIKRDRLRGD